MCAEDRGRSALASRTLSRNSRLRAASLVRTRRREPDSHPRATPKPALFSGPVCGSIAGLISRSALMSVDRSRRRKSSLERHRNVLSRAERVTRLIAEVRFAEDTSPLGLPKVCTARCTPARRRSRRKRLPLRATRPAGIGSRAGGSSGCSAPDSVRRFGIRPEPIALLHPCTPIARGACAGAGPRSTPVGRMSVHTC